MREWTNNGVKVIKPTGCWLCKNLEFYEKDSYESVGESGWGCESNENSENFKDFPCKRRLKCFEPDEKLMKAYNIKVPKTRANPVKEGSEVKKSE